MIQELLEDVFFPLFVNTVAVLTVIAAFLVFVNFALAEPGCYAKTAQMGLKAQYGFYTGCMVEVDGKWIPYSAYEKRVIEQNISVRVR